MVRRAPARRPKRRGCAPSPLILRRHVIPAKAGTYSPLAAPAGGNGTARDTRPLRGRPPHPLRWIRRRAGDLGGDRRGGRERALHSAPFLPQTAPIQSHRRPKVNHTLGVNGAKWGRMAQLLKQSASGRPGQRRPAPGKSGSAVSPMPSCNRRARALGTGRIAPRPHYSPRPTSFPRKREPTPSGRRMDFGLRRNDGERATAGRTARR